MPLPRDLLVFGMFPPFPGKALVGSMESMVKSLKEVAAEKFLGVPSTLKDLTESLTTKSVKGATIDRLDVRGTKAERLQSRLLGFPPSSVGPAASLGSPLAPDFLELLFFGIPDAIIWLSNSSSFSSHTELLSLLSSLPGDFADEDDDFLGEFVLRVKQLRSLSEVEFEKFNGVPSSA